MLIALLILALVAFVLGLVTAAKILFVVAAVLVLAGVLSNLFNRGG